MTELVNLADVEPVEIDWLWYPWIPRSYLTILEGDPGIGKSFLIGAITAALSAGKPLPGRDPAPPCSVLLLAQEDGLADTVRPRLDGLGADPSRVFAFRDLQVLDGSWLRDVEEAIERTHPALIVLDPLTAFLPARVDIHRANETRQALVPIVALAERFGAALVAVRHLAKSRGGGNPTYAGLGSIDFAARARSVIHVGADPNSESVGAIFHVKSNIGPKARPIGYGLHDGTFTWEKTTLRIEDVMRSGSDGALEDAIAFLEDVLSLGPLPAEEVMTRAASEGISKSTLKRAKHRVGVESVKTGFGAHGRWEWEKKTPTQLG